MDETLLCWSLLCFIILWRQLGKLICVQKILHIFGRATPFLQWYGLMVIGLGLLLFRTFYDIVVYDYIKFDFLRSQAMFSGLNLIPNLTDADREDMGMSPGVRIIALVAPVAGVIAFLIVAQHVKSNVAYGHKMRLESDNTEQMKLPWQPTMRQNMVLLVIAMPAVFIVMAMRSEIRMWAVMTGSAWIPYSRMETPTLTWAQVKTLQLSTYTTDLELASTFQYYTVWSFGQLCTSYLVRAPTEYRQALTWAGLQGVYFYVLIGVLRSIGDFVVAVLSESQDPVKVYYAQQLQAKFLDQLGLVFTVGTLLCVYNMYIIAKMGDVTSHLGKASLKFQATRLLLLVSQIQLQVLVGITAGSKLQAMIEKLPEPLNHTADYLHLSVYRAKLLHASLLGFECLIIVVINRCMWSNTDTLFEVDDELLQESNGSGDYKELPGGTA